MMSHVARRSAFVVLAVLSTLAPSVAMGQSSGTQSIRGVVTDTSGMPLAGAEIAALDQASGETRSVLSEENGVFVIGPVRPGRYRVDTRITGYERFSEEVVVASTGDANLAIRLVGTAVALDPIMVIGTRSAQMRALEEKRSSTNIREIAVADEVGKLPDRGLADAVSRLTGVSVRQGVGDARYVSIRGIAPELNQVKVNGQASAISDVDARAGRAGPLDVVGSGDFASIEVIKTLTPDLDAQGLGGQLNVSTPSALERGERFASAQLDYGGNGVNDQADYSFSFGAADVLLDERLGVYLGGSFARRDFTFDRLEGSWMQFDGISIPSQQMLKLVDEDRDRWSVSANIEFGPNDGTVLYARSVFNQVDEFGIRDEVNTRLRSGLALSGPLQGTAERSNIELKTRRQDSRRRIANLTVGAEQRFGGNGGWLWEPSLTYSTASEDREIIFVNTNVSDDVPASFNAAEYIYQIDADARFDASHIELDRLRFDGGLQEEGLAVLQNDLTWTRDGDRILGQPGRMRFKLGGKATLRDRSVDEYSDRHRPIEPLFMTDFMTAGPSDFRDRFSFGPRADVSGLTGYFEANRDLFFYDEVGAVINGAEDDYNADERIYAAYLLGELELGRVMVLGGVRVERTDLTMSAMQASYVDDEFLGLDERELATDYTNIFPNLQVRLAATDRLVVRGAFTTSVGRPDFVDLAPITELEAIQLEPGVFAGGVSEGNPHLQPFEAVNADVSLEYYFGQGNLLAANAFQKWIDNPVFSRRENLTGIEYDGRYFETLTLQTTRNADQGEIRGIELTYQHQLTFLPGALAGLGLAANAAFMDSEVTVFERDEVLPFFGQPDRILNAQLFYERTPVQARVAVQRTDESLISLGGNVESDVYDDARTTVDAKLTYRVRPNAFLFIEGQNLTGEDRRVYQGRAGQLLLDEGFGSVYRLGLNWSL